MQVEKCRLIEFQKCDDNRGKMSVIEGSKNIPFDIKRIFYTYDISDDVKRAEHANRKSEFIFICLSGSALVTVDYGNEKEQFVLNNPSIGLYIPKMLWKDISNYSKDCVMLILSNEYYDSSEYIKDYNEYLKEIS